MYSTSSIITWASSNKQRNLLYAATTYKFNDLDWIVIRVVTGFLRNYS